MNHAKILKAPKMPLGSWYLSGTKHFPPTNWTGGNEKAHKVK